MSASPREKKSWSVLRKGETWNESETYRDHWTLRRVRRVTSAGLYNQTPTYHANIGSTADGEFLILGSAREGRSFILRCHVPTGGLTALIEPGAGMGYYGAFHKSSGSDLGDGMGVTSQMCTAPHSRWAVYTVGRTLCAVHIETLEERILIQDIGEGWVSGRAGVDPKEEQVIIPAALAVL